MEEKKTSILALLKVLEKYSDEDHILSQPQLLQLIESEYGITLDRRTLYRNVEMLNDFGYDISDFKDNKVGYYLRDRLFEKSEILLLCNEIHSSNLIPAKASKDLINKLLSTQSKYLKSEYTSSVYLDNKNKKDNKQFFLNIETITSAIKDKKVISFNSTKYDLNKNLVNKRDELYYRSPYYLVALGDRVYMVGKGKGHTSLSHFRVDRMRDITITNEPYINIESIDPYEYAKNKIFMFSGDETRVCLRCKLDILDQMIDTFGKDVNIVPEEDTFLLYTNCGISDVLHLAMQYLESLEVIEPVEIRNQIKDMIKESLNKYDK